MSSSVAFFMQVKKACEFNALKNLKDAIKYAQKNAI